MPRIFLPSGRSFESEAGESLLDAALRCGVALEYSCRSGRCSSCKARIRAGASTVIHPETGLAADEHAVGWILCCARSATTDIELDIQDLGDVRLAPPRTLPCRIQHLERVCADVMKVVLRLPPTQAFDYHAGQSIEVIGAGGLRRSYSIANAAGADRHIELHVRRVPGGAMSRYWFDEARPDDLLRLHGPQGTFFLRDLAGRDLVFLATGTGIAPVKAMLEQLSADGAEAGAAAPRSVRVYWGARLEQDLYWNPARAGLNPLQYVPVLSRAAAAWPGARGHVQDAFLAQGPDLANSVVYACGSDAMVQAARKQLLAAGLGAQHFRSDAFVCSS